MTAEKHKIQHTYKQKELLMRYQQFFFVSVSYTHLTLPTICSV